MVLRVCVVVASSRAFVCVFLRLPHVWSVWVCSALKAQPRDSAERGFPFRLIYRMGDGRRTLINTLEVFVSLKGPPGTCFMPGLG